MIGKDSTRAKWLVLLAAIAMVAVACSSSGSSAAPSAAAPSAAAPSERRAVRGGARARRPRHTRSGTRTAAASATASARSRSARPRPRPWPPARSPSSPSIHRNTDAAGQLQDIRDLIAKGVDAIVFNPNDPAALNPALAEAKAAGIETVSVDAYVTDPDTYNLYNNQDRIRVARRQVAVRADGRQRAPSTTCAASPAIRPTATVTSASRNVLKRVPEHQGRPER